jgi:hypothetical protein
MRDDSESRQEQDPKADASCKPLGQEHLPVRLAQARHEDPVENVWEPRKGTLFGAHTRGRRW